jgi:3-hydroxybutyryl-CoA dehydrogenase
MLKIGIVGSGAMGSGIAQVAASSGEEVWVYDTNDEALLKAKSGITSSLGKLKEKGKLTEQDIAAVLLRIHFVNEFRSLKDCELIIEAVIEDVTLKRKVFSDLEKIVSSSCILASNTSSLSIASISAACEDPGRVIGIHFFNPPVLMPLVEIIPSIATKPGLDTFCRDLIAKWKKIPVIAKDTPGFIVNRVARSYYGESIRLYEEGYASFETIDWAMKEFGGFKMGPFELMDFIGNDVNYRVTESVWQQFFCEPRFKPSLTQKRLFEAGFFGRKSGRGYYDYSEGAKRNEPVKDPVKGKLLFERVLAMLINEAADSLYLGIASKDDLELAMVNGVNYPKGLLKWADEWGPDKVLNVLQNLEAEYGEERYRPSVLLKRMVKAGKNFY